MGIERYPQDHNITIFHTFIKGRVAAGGDGIQEALWSGRHPDGDT